MSVVKLDKENFEAEVLKSDKLVFVDMYAEWCPPCKMIAPLIDKLAEEYQGMAKIAKLNVDEAQEIAMTYGAESIPTLLFFKQGEVVEKIVGALPYEVLAQKIKDNL